MQLPHMEGNNSIILDPRDPIQIYVDHKNTRRKMKIIKLMPSLSALKNNVRYQISGGNDKRVFSMHKWKGISSLKLRRTIHKPRIFHLKLDATPLKRMTNIAGIALEKMTVHVDVHIL